MAGVNSADLATSLDELTMTNRDSATISKTRGSSELGKEEFLQLLVTQLSNQDPLNPQSDQEFIAQLAQFSSLEQMTNLNATFSNTSAYSMVGKEVVVQKVSESGETTEVRGVVDYVQIKNGTAYLSINGQTYEMDDLVQVLDTTYAAQDYLPSMEAQELVFDLNNISWSQVKLDLGSNGYEASSVAVSVNGQWLDSSLMSYDDGILRISPEAFSGLMPGSYYLGFSFDDPYGTTITDKVLVKVVNSGIETEGTEDGTTDDAEVEETE